MCSSSVQPDVNASDAGLPLRVKSADVDFSQTFRSQSSELFEAGGGDAPEFCAAHGDMQSKRLGKERVQYPDTHGHGYHPQANMHYHSSALSRVNSDPQFYFSRRYHLSGHATPSTLGLQRTLSNDSVGSELHNVPFDGTTTDDNRSQHTTSTRDGRSHAGRSKVEIPRSKSRPRPEAERFSCDQCTETFSRKDDMERHKGDIHRSGRKKYACSFCGYENNREDKMKHHCGPKGKGHGEVVCTATDSPESTDGSAAV